jgi:hypothetical protein
MRTVDVDRKELTAYAWPGGYPVMYLAMDGWREDDGTLTVNDRSENACCAKCAADVNGWPDIISFTESAYGDPDAEDE